LGGQTMAIENSVCDFGDDLSCPTKELYNGTCQRGDNQLKIDEQNNLDEK